MTLRKKRAILLIILPFVAFPAILFLQLSVRLLIGAEPSFVKTVVNILSVVLAFIGTIGFFPSIIAGVRLLLTTDIKNQTKKQPQSVRSQKHGADNYIESTSESVRKDR